MSQIQTKITTILLNSLSVLLGLFLLFALLYNAETGSILITTSLIIAGCALILFAAPSGRYNKTNPKFKLALFAGATYSPSVYNRFSGCYGVDWGGFKGDIFYIVFICILAIWYKLQQQTEIT